MRSLAIVVPICLLWLGACCCPASMRLRWIMLPLLLVAVAGAACTRSQYTGCARTTEAWRPASLSVTAPLRGRHHVPVGTSPSDLLLVDGGRTLVCKNIEEHSLSLIDLATRRETARIRLPVTEKNPDGTPTAGYLTGLTEDPASRTLWAVSNEGQIFTVKLRTRRVSTRHTFDPNDGLASDYIAAAWDPDRTRLLISAAEGGAIESEQGVLLFFASGRLEFLAGTSMPIGQMERRGSMLYYVSSKSGIVGEGSLDSAVGAFDLTSDRIAFGGIRYQVYSYGLCDHACVSRESSAEDVACRGRSEMTRLAACTTS